MKMIGLVGRAGSGKSSVAGIISERGYHVMSMASAIRKAVIAAFPQLDPAYLHELKAEKIPNMECTGRELLQNWGHEMGRNLCGKNCWIDSIDTEINMLKLDHRRICIDDVRYDNEVQYIKSKGGVIIGVDRPMTDNADTVVEDWREHASEDGVTSDLVDEWIANISNYRTDLVLATDNVLDSLVYFDSDE